jgi:hypothetical protein
MKNGGGLLVHKGTHHFDLLNWYLDDEPVSVYATGSREVFGDANAFYGERCSTCPHSKNCWAVLKSTLEDADLNPGSDGDIFNKLYFDTEKYDAYVRDRSVFSDGISIEDNMSVTVPYENTVVMNYTLCAHCPYEGYRICFNGTKGRLEFYVIESGVTATDEDMSSFGNRENESDRDRKDMAPEIIFQPFWGKPQIFTYDNTSKAGHGGGDVKLMNNLFFGAEDDPLSHAADFHDAGCVQPVRNIYHKLVKICLAALLGRLHHSCECVLPVSPVQYHKKLSSVFIPHYIGVTFPYAHTTW